jgi:hypothetical protein
MTERMGKKRFHVPIVIREVPVSILRFYAPFMLFQRLRLFAY